MMKPHSAVVTLESEIHMLQKVWWHCQRLLYRAWIIHLFPIFFPRLCVLSKRTLMVNRVHCWNHLHAHPHLQQRHGPVEPRRQPWVQQTSLRSGSGKMKHILNFTLLCLAACMENFTNHLPSPSPLFRQCYNNMLTQADRFHTFIFALK